MGGSVAAMVCGEPRLTNYIDLVLDLDHRNAEDLARAFSSDQFYCPLSEVIAIEARRGHRGHLNLIHSESGYKADVYMRGRDPLHDWGLERRRSVELGGGHPARNEAVDG